MKNQCLQDEGLDCSSHCMRAFVCCFEGSHMVPYQNHFILGLVIKMSLELMASTLGSTFQKEEVFEPLCWHHILCKFF